MGRTAEEDFRVEIICPICEETTANARSILHQEPLKNEHEPEYPNDRAMSWMAEVMHREREDAEAIVLVRLLREERECDFYEFPPVTWRGNGVHR